MFLVVMFTNLNTLWIVLLQLLAFSSIKGFTEQPKDISVWCPVATSELPPNVYYYEKTSCIGRVNFSGYLPGTYLINKGEIIVTLHNKVYHINKDIEVLCNIYPRWVIVNRFTYVLYEKYAFPVDPEQPKAIRWNICRVQSGHGHYIIGKVNFGQLEDDKEGRCKIAYQEKEYSKATYELLMNP